MYTNATAYPDYFSTTNISAGAVNELDEEDLQPAATSHNRRTSHLSSTSNSSNTAPTHSLNQFHQSASAEWLPGEEPPAFFSDTTTKDPFHQQQQQPTSYQPVKQHVQGSGKTFAPAHYFTTDEEVVGGGGGSKETDEYDWFQSSYAREEPAAVDPTSITMQKEEAPVQQQFDYSQYQSDAMTQQYDYSHAHAYDATQQYDASQVYDATQPQQYDSAQVYDATQQYDSSQQYDYTHQYDATQQFVSSNQYDTTTLPSSQQYDSFQQYDSSHQQYDPSQYDMPSQQQHYDATHGSQPDAVQAKLPVVHINYESYARDDQSHIHPPAPQVIAPFMNEAVEEKAPPAIKPSVNEAVEKVAPTATDVSYFGYQGESANFSAQPQEAVQDDNGFTFQQETNNDKFTFAVPQEQQQDDSNSFAFDSYQQQQSESFPIDQSQAEYHSHFEAPPQTPNEVNYFERPVDSQQYNEDDSYFYPTSSTNATADTVAPTQKPSYNAQSNYFTDSQATYTNDYFTQASAQPPVEPLQPSVPTTASPQLGIKLCAKCAFENLSKVNFCGMCGHQLVEKLEVLNMLENLSISSNSSTTPPFPANVAVHGSLPTAAIGVGLGMAASSVAKPPLSPVLANKSPMMANRSPVMGNNSPVMAKTIPTPTMSPVVESRIHPTVSFGCGGKTFYTFPKSQVRYNAASQPITKYTPDAVHVRTLMPEVTATPLLGLSKKELGKVLESFEGDVELKKVLGLMLEYGPKFMGEAKAKQKLISEVLRTENALNFGASTGAFFTSKFRSSLEQRELKKAFMGALEDQDWTSAFLVLPMLRREDALELHKCLSESLPRGDPLKLFISVSVNLPLSEAYLGELAQDWRQSVGLCLSLNTPGLDKVLLGLVPYCKEADKMLLQLLAGEEEPNMSLELSELHEAVLHAGNSSFFKAELFPHKLAMAERLALDTNGLDYSRKYLQAISSCLKTSTKPVNPQILQRMKALEERVGSMSSGDVGSSGKVGASGWKGLFDVIDKGMQRLVGVEDEVTPPAKVEYGDYRPEPTYEPPRSHEQKSQYQSSGGYEPPHTYNSAYSYEPTTQQQYDGQSYEPVTQESDQSYGGYSHPYEVTAEDQQQPVYGEQYQQQQEYQFGGEYHQQQEHQHGEADYQYGGDYQQAYLDGGDYQQQQQAYPDGGDYQQAYPDGGEYQQAYPDGDQQTQAAYDASQNAYAEPYSSYTQTYDEAQATTDIQSHNTQQPYDAQVGSSIGTQQTYGHQSHSASQASAMVPTIKLSPTMPMAPTIPMPKVSTDFQPTPQYTAATNNSATLAAEDDLGFGNKPRKSEAPTTSPVSSSLKKSDATNGASAGSVFSFIKKMLPMGGGASASPAAGGADTSSPSLSNKSSTQANLGKESSFYFDKNLKRWVNKGEEDNVSAALPPPPPRVSAPPVPMALEASPTSGSLGDVSNMTPPLSSSTNTNAARKPTNMRSKYVDTFATSTTAANGSEHNAATSSHAISTAANGSENRAAATTTHYQPDDHDLLKTF